MDWERKVCTPKSKKKEWGMNEWKKKKRKSRKEENKYEKKKFVAIRLGVQRINLR